MMKRCFDKRVWIGAGVLAAGLFLASPRAGWPALPVLAGLACPLSMLVTMHGMRQGGACTRGPDEARQAGAAQAAGIARLRREIEQLKQHASVPAVPAADDSAAAAREILAPSRRGSDGGNQG